MSRQQQRNGSGAVPGRVPRSTRTVSNTRAGAGGAGRPSATSRVLSRNATTAKGAAVQKDLNDLADDYFGGTAPSAPVASSSSQAGNEGTFSRFRTSFAPAAVPASWRRGPSDPAGKMYDASDRNLLCMDVFFPRRGVGSKAANPLCVVGSADHGLKVFDPVTMKEKKNLYTKTYGHSEWVTCCKFFTDGRIVSGGMDNKLCLWDSALRGGVRCQDLLGHTGSISAVDVNEAGIVASASYDRTIRLWNCGSGAGSEVGCLAGHKNPVTHFSWCGTRILSGDRQGTAKLWDVSTAQCVNTMATKRGQIGALEHLLHSDIGHLIMFGDQGGVLTVLDPRQGKTPVFQEELHPGGVVSGIRTVDHKPYVVTCGADRRVLVLDPRMGYSAVQEFADHTDFIYSMETLGPLVISGAGNGWLLVHDTETGKCCYGLGANTAAVREIFANPDLLIAAGDDGKAAVFDYTGLL